MSALVQVATTVFVLACFVGGIKLEAWSHDRCSTSCLHCGRRFVARTRWGLHHRAMHHVRRTHSQSPTHFSPLGNVLAAIDYSDAP